MFIRNWKVSTKILCVLILSVMFMTAIGISSFFSLEGVTAKSKKMYEEKLVSSGLIQHILFNNAQIDSYNLERLIDTSSANNDSLLRQIQDRVTENIEVQKAFEAIPMTTEIQEQYTLFKSLITQNNEVKQQFDAHLAAGSQEDAYRVYTDQLKPIRAKMIGAIEAIVGNQQADALTFYEESKASAQRSNVLTALLTVLAVVLCGLIGLLIARSITRPVRQLQDVMARVRNNDLTAEVKYQSKDELGQLSDAVNATVKNLRSIIDHILDASSNVAASSQQISANSDDVSTGSIKQAEDTQMIAELFKELSTAVNDVAVRAENAAELSANTVNIAVEGGAVIQSSIQSMDEVNEQMKLLEKDSERIGEIIAVIDEISGQTNLLALNAAIEAARAGEQGRGFAVVAAEVRKLAERSVGATKQISAIICQIQENTRNSARAVSDGVVHSRQTQASFEQIMLKVNDTSEQITMIAAACEEQAAQTALVMQSIESIASISEETAAATQETAATSQSLAKLAEGLSETVNVFKV
ncbi:methyl-accepting chemotaxis protein ['Paenibacillus yunnanensis' Narsing Rao et al. 2020]|uniref:methyl-accepting chemotaxis protein n=1 Tax=Paenibacillus tengchongensis TaxID=2608684 RepID=UPI00124E013D|nr:methyl-accepting chemotaxis protein [Paenibacillus tengchongensis]